MDTVTLAGFVTVSIVGIATPGPDVLLAIRNGSRHGILRSVEGIVGVALSDLLIMGAVAFGLGAVLAASEIFYLAAKLLGVAYLSYIGLTLVFARALPTIDHVNTELVQLDYSAELFLRGFFVAFTNVKVWLFFAAFLPQFISHDQAQIPQYMTLALVFEMLNITILVVYACLGAGATHVFKGATAMWLDRTSGVLLLCLAVSIMFYQRNIVQ
jgi:threonine/homoserine/homoserine lactone efflux protein